MYCDSLHPSILADSGADLLTYGMGERVIQQVARAMNNGFNAKLLRNIRQVGFMACLLYTSCGYRRDLTLREKPSSRSSHAARRRCGWRCV